MRVLTKPTNRRTEMKAHLALKYITPDEVAECWEGVDEELYSALWGCVPKYDNKWRENIEDMGPYDVIGVNSVSKFWSSFSMHHKRQLNNLAVRSEKMGIGDIWSEEGDIG
jgi:hypothetical protein